MKIYTYSENEKEFILIDGRNIDAGRYRKRQVIRPLCSFYGASGLMIIGKSGNADFSLELYNAKGYPENGDSSAEGLRSAVSFADLLGVKGFYAEGYDLEAFGTVLHADILSRNGEEKTIALADGSSGTAICEGECCGD